MTSDKPNMRLENTLQSINNKGVFLENTLQSQEIINETNVLYQSIKDNISKLNKEVEVKNADLEDYNIIEKNYNKILQSSKNDQLREFEEHNRQEKYSNLLYTIKRLKDIIVFRL